MLLWWSGVARGTITPEEARLVDLRFREVFAKERIVFDDVLYCFHGPGDGCECRKPNPGMLLSAIRMHALDPLRSLMIGDKASDVLAGERAQMRGILFTNWAQVRVQIETAPSFD
jgi:D-glycero-D-manno-heptose 1,7-bisphosphate phosphatase